MSRSTSEGGLWAKFKSCANLNRSSPDTKTPSPYMPRSRTSLTLSEASGFKEGSMLGVARSRTQEDVRSEEDVVKQEEFLDEELDLKTMLQTTCGKARESGRSSKREDIKSTNDSKQFKENDAYDSSPYDSDESDGIIEANEVNIIHVPSYEDFVKSKEENIDKTNDEIG